MPSRYDVPSFDYYGILAASGTSRVFEARVPRRGPGPIVDPERAGPPPATPVPAARRRDRARPETGGPVGKSVSSQTAAAAKKPSAKPGAADRSRRIEDKKKDAATDAATDAADEDATSCYDATDAEASDVELPSFLRDRRRRPYGPPHPAPSEYAALGSMNPYAETGPAAPRAPSPVPVAIAIPVRRAPAEALRAMEIELPMDEEEDEHARRR